MGARRTRTSDLGSIAASAVWPTSLVKDLGTIPGRHPDSEAPAINERGQIVGCTNTRNGTSHAWRWENGKLRDLGRALAGPDPLHATPLVEAAPWP